MISLFSLTVPLFSNPEKYSDQNRLKGSSSPYLLQHADNPVHWLPWGKKAFEEARRLGRPVLVSIGYSTCHWCHVMEHESFEDPVTASIMNRYLITIKVDREQLPGVDAFYMEAVSLMGGSTGWPLNVFVDQDGKPFYGGTYFPKDKWESLIRRVGELWATRRTDLIESGQSLTDAMNRYSEKTPAKAHKEITQEETKEIISRYVTSLSARFDSKYPGFPAPGGTQFPPNTTLAFLLELRNSKGRDMAEKILKTMEDSGLQDRVGGGFHRYATDRAWRIPHFEKMLYDNAQLMALYARASVLFNRKDFLQTSTDIGDYLIRDMEVHTGVDQSYGFATAEDADDPAGEGAFYSWPPEDLKKALPEKEAKALIRFWDIKTFSAKRNNQPEEGWIPYPLGGSGVLPQGIDIRLIRKTLLKVRGKRPRPNRDTKVLTGLNGLALEGFALLARTSGELRFRQTVKELSSFLTHRYRRQGIIREPGVPAYITDYAFMILGLTAAYPVLEDPELVQTAEEIAAQAVKDLSAGNGTFYSNPEGSLNLPIRKVDPFDTQIPSGMNALALGFARLYGITGIPSYREYAQNIIASQRESINSYPSAYSTLLRANLLLHRKWHIVLAGNPDLPAYDELKNKLLYLLGPDYLIIYSRGNGNDSWTLLQGRKGLTIPQVLICNDSACLLPAYNTSELESRLSESGIIRS